jgi:hypothetical protein
MQADVIMLEKSIMSAADLLSEIDGYAAKYPGSFRTADLWELKWRVMKKQNMSEAEIMEHLQTFVDTFPADLRSGRFRKILARHSGKTVPANPGDEK